jgi:hypothetical protein
VEHGAHFLISYTTHAGGGAGELEALSGAVMECQRTASQHDSMMCQLCSHCPTQNFPVCNRCQHAVRPSFGVPEQKKVKGKRMFYR